MTDDSAAILDDLLCRWHAWRPVVNVGRGYGGSGPAFKQFRCSRQNDDVNGALWEDEENAIMHAVDVQIHALLPIHHIAICTHARALAMGTAVFSNPRLPADKGERDALVSQARTALLVRLTNAGVV